MRTINQVLEQLQEVGVEQYGYEVLSLWGKEIIEECAGNFEWSMKEDHDSGPGDTYRTYHAVLHHSSILAVKEMIK